MRDLFSDIIPFVTVAEQGSFRAAAARLGVTPAAVSKAISRLEDEVGVQLFHRTTRSVSLSTEGRSFLERCRDAIDQVRTGREQLDTSRKVARGRLVVSLSFVFSQMLIRGLPRFLDRYPMLEIQLRYSDRYARLVEDDVDVAIRFGELADSSLVARRLTGTRWATVASPAYLARRGHPQQVSNLVHHDCLTFVGPQGITTPWPFEDRDTPELSPSGPLDANHGEALVQCALAGMGICHAFDFMVRDLVREGRLVELFQDRAAPGPPIHALCLPGQQHVPRIRAFLDFSSDHFTDSMGSRA